MPRMLEMELMDLSPRQIRAIYKPHTLLTFSEPIIIKANVIQTPLIFLIHLPLCSRNTHQMALMI